MEEIYFDENVRKFVDILFEKDYVVLLSLVESLDSQENKNNADEVAQTLLDFLITNKRILPVLNLLISKEIDFIDNPTTLFRRNSVCSKMLSRFTKINGSEFLDSILKQLMEELNQKDKGQYEVDPKKVDPKKIEENSIQLKMLLEEFIVEVLNSLDLLPISLRIICNHLRGGASEKFGEKMGRSAIGGYIFLRYVCPAMVAPEQFGLNSNISAFAKRTLIIVSKVLQNLANGITVFKETYLEFLNGFMLDNIGLFNSYLDNLCELNEELDFRKIEYKGGVNGNEALISIHKYLKNNIHKIGSIIANHGSDQKKSTGFISGLEKSGWMRKLGGNVKIWKKRWFVLKTGSLFYFKGPQDPSSTGRIPLGLKVVYEESTENPTQFTVKTEVRNYLLETETEAEKKDWLRALRISYSDTHEKIEKKNELRMSSTIKRESTAIGDDISGYLLKAGPDGKNYQRRFFVLNKSHLLYFKNQHDNSPTGEIPLSDCRTRKGEGNCFEIENEKTKRVFYLQATDKKDQDFWLNELKKAKARHFKNAPKTQENTKDNMWLIESKEIDKEGFMEKQGGNFKSWKKRWFVLKGEVLFYYKAPVSPEPLGEIDMVKSTIMDGGSGSCSFQILTRTRTWFMRTNDPEKTLDWVNVLKNAAFKNEIEKEHPPKKVQEQSGEEIVEQGWLQKQGGKIRNWRRRWFVLKTNTLSYYKNPGDLVAAGVIPLGKSCAVAIAEDKLEKKFTFEVFTRTRNFFLQAKDEYDMAKWMKSIEKVSTSNNTGPQNELMEIFFRLNFVLSEWEGLK